MKVRYAVIGLGHIAQVAVLPAFQHAGENSILAALVSGDAVKRRILSRQYGVPAYDYAQLGECLRSGAIDAVYVALPNSRHRDAVVEAAEAGVHVLCEKPMAVTEPECLEMIDAAARGGVKLMVAYRLHFEDANMEAVELARSGRLGELRFFESAFSMQVKPGDIRVRATLGGGTLYDIGIYCINAARYLFESEPIEVLAVSVSNGERRFREVDEATAALLRFPGERLATFVSSFGAADVSSYRIAGTKGWLRCEPAYEYAMELKHQWEIEGKPGERTFGRRDQFAAELVYFSDCVINDREPEPSGREGLADVRVIRALYRSAVDGRPVRLEGYDKGARPGPGQEIRRPPVKAPPLVRAHPPRY